MEADAIICKEESSNVAGLYRELRSYLEPLYGLSRFEGKESTLNSTVQIYGRAQRYVRFLCRLLKVSFNKLTKPISTSEADEFFRALKLALDCLDTLRPRLGGNPYQIEVLRHWMVKRLMAWKRFTEAREECWVTLHSLKVNIFCKDGKGENEVVASARKSSVKEKGNENENDGVNLYGELAEAADPGLVRLVLGLVPHLIICTGESKLREANEYRKVLVLIDQLVPWQRQDLNENVCPSGKSYHMDCLRHQLAITYCVRASCIQERNLGPQAILDDISSALKLWSCIFSSELLDLNNDQKDWLFDTSVPLLFDMPQLLALKGYIYLQSEVQEMILHILSALKKISPEECCALLWRERRLNHVLCCVPFSANIFSTLIDKVGIDTNSIKFWESSLNDCLGSFLEFQQKLMYDMFFEVQEDRDCSTDSSLRCFNTTEFLKDMGQNSIQSSCVTSNLFYILSEKCRTNGKLSEGLRHNNSRDVIERAQQVLRPTPDKLDCLEPFVTNFFRSVPLPTIVCISLLDCRYASILEGSFNNSSSAWIFISRFDSDGPPVVLLLPIHSMLNGTRTDAVEGINLCSLYSIRNLEADDLKGNDICSTSKVMDVVAQEFRLLLEENLLSGSGISLVASNEENIRQWQWRKQIDNRLANLLRGIEDSWLGPWKCLLLGKPSEAAYCDALQTHMQELKSMIDSAALNIQREDYFPVDTGLLKTLLGGVPSLTNNEIEKCICCLLWWKYFKLLQRPSMAHMTSLDCSMEWNGKEHMHGSILSLHVDEGYACPDIIGKTAKELTSIFQRAASRKNNYYNIDGNKPRKSSRKMIKRRRQYRIQIL